MPISVKTRLSFDWNQNLINFVKWLESAWASLVTIHGRTAKQAYTWKADFTNIYELKEKIWIPVICNWDILNYTDWMQKVKNLDWIMMWRASFWNPWCFIWEKQINDEEFLKKSPIKEIIVTDTIELSEDKKFDKLTILSTNEIFGEVLRRIVTGKEVSNLFKK